jgi:hypothetical protein
VKEMVREKKKNKTKSIPLRSIEEKELARKLTAKTLSPRSTAREVVHKNE